LTRDQRNIINALKKHQKPWLAIRDLNETDKETLRELSSAQIAQAIDAPQRDRAVRESLLTASRYNKKQIKERIETAQSDLADKINSLLQRTRDTHYTYEELSEKFDRSTSSIKVAIQSLADSGIQLKEQITDTSSKISLPSGGCTQATKQIDFRGDEITFGVVSDTHLGSTHCALDMLENAYDLFEQEGVKHVLHAGDLTEGPGNRGYRGHSNDVLDSCQDWRGLEAYVSETYPRRKNLTTYCISSSKSHDGWEYNASGRCPTADVCNGRSDIKPLKARDDMEWLGHDCADFRIGGLLTRLLHPDGGSAYAASYKAQKFIEAMPGGTKPHLLFIGHFHSYCTVRVRNVIGINVPGMQWSTPLFIRYAKEPTVGALLIRARLDAEGSLRSCQIEDLIHYHADNKR